MVEAGDARPHHILLQRLRRWREHSSVLVIGAVAALGVVVALGVGPPSFDGVRASNGLSLRTGELALALQAGDATALEVARRRVGQELDTLAALGVPADAANLRWAELRGLLEAGRQDALAPALAALKQTADGIAAEEQRALKARRQRRDLALGAGAALAAGCLVWAGVSLRRQRRQLRHLANSVSSDLGSGAWRQAVRTMRDTTVAAPSAFDAMASGLEEVLGESDRRWRALAEMAADWYWETDRQQRLTWSSGAGALAARPGLRPADLLGLRLDQIEALEPPADGWEALHEVVAAGRSFRDLELRLRAEPGDDGDARWIAISGRPRLDAEGRVLGYEGVGRDVSERKRAVARLRASEQRWSLMAGLSSEYYWETDTEHRMLPLRPEVARRFGPLAERGEHCPPWETYPDAMTAERWDEHRADIAARRPFHAVEMDIDLGGGRHRILAVSGIPRFDGQGRFLGYHGIGRDITLRREAERLMLRHNEQLQKAVDDRTQVLQQINADLDAFARHLAHELRTPIGQVQGLAALLVRKAGDRLSADEMQLVGLQLRAARQMRETLDALLALARSTSQPLQFEDLDLGALAQQVAAELDPIERHAPVNWQLPLGLRVRGSEPALRIVLQNLLGNAAKFTRDAEAPEVVLEGESDGNGLLRLRLRDNGAGFPAEYATRLFQPFSRLHGGERYAGTGIGLTIVQRIVERHGGHVTARGETGRGAVFEWTLPAAKA